MAKYQVERACGHVEEVQLYGPSKDRKWRLENVESKKLCRECWQKQVDEANAKAAEQVEEMALPDLTGSEKQIAWANSIRLEKLAELDRLVYHDLPEEQASNPQWPAVLDYARNQMTDAKWWIDNRRSNIKSLVRSILTKWDAGGRPTSSDEKAKREAEKARQKAEALAEATVRPEEPVAEAAAEIREDNNEIMVIAERNEKLREVVRDLGYRWSGGAWHKSILHDDGADRVAEVGSRLLNAGIPITLFDAELRVKAIDADYEPEQTRWIMLRTSGYYEGWLAINWRDRDDVLYQKARSLPGSRWSKPSVVVRADHYLAVEEFAELYDFEFSDAARKAIEVVKERSGDTVNPAPSKEMEHEDGLQKILESGDEIIDDLKDEPTTPSDSGC